MKKILFLILITILTINGQFAGGTGTSGDPYLISTPAQLDSVRNYGCGGNLYTVHFKMINNIDMGSYTTNWQPIGTSSSNFTANFDGGGYTISNLKKNIIDVNYIGLFGYAGGTNPTYIKNIILDGFEFIFPSRSISSVSTASCGLLIGWNTGIDSVKNIIIRNSTLQTTSTGTDYNLFFGLLMGQTTQPTTRCGIENSIIDIVSNNQEVVSGLVGRGGVFSECYLDNVLVTGYRASVFLSHNFSGISQSGSTMADCYFYGGSVINSYPFLTDDGLNYISGINQDPSAGQINHVYFAGELETRAPSQTTLVTWDTNIDVSDCIVDTVLSGVTNDAGIGLVKSDSTTMKSQSTYESLGFDFNTVWAIDPSINSGYPYLQWAYEDPISADRIKGFNINLNLKRVFK